MNRYVKLALIYAGSQTLLASGLFEVLEHPFLQLDSLTIAVWVNFLINLTVVVAGCVFLRNDLVRDYQALKSGSRFLTAVFLGMGGIFLSSQLCSYLIQMTNSGSVDSINQQTAEAIFQSSPFLMGVTATLLAPIAEEFVFRVSIINLMPIPWLGLVLSTLLFGWMHVAAGGDYMHILPYGISGFILGVAYLKSDNVWYPIGIHLGNNLLITLMQFI